MRNIDSGIITDAVAKCCRDACCHIDKDILEIIKSGRAKEESALSKNVLQQILDNAELAAEKQKPACQDCGTAVIFAEVGQDLHIEGSFEEAVNTGVAKGYEEGYLRKSICNPFTRANTGNNLPAVIHTKLVEGDKLKITVLPKGGGAENVSALEMLVPAAGIDGIKEFVIETVKKAGPNPCPPMVIGVGIGGNFETAPLMAKEALAWSENYQNPNPEAVKLEAELLEELNKLNIGPGGFGGATSVLSVRVNTAPCHIASLPCAVNINCHSVRHSTIIL